MPPVQVYLGPLLGFLFTCGTLLFVALNAHRTVPTLLTTNEPNAVPGDAAPPEGAGLNLPPVEPMGPDGTGLGTPTVHAVEPNEPNHENT